MTVVLKEYVLARSTVTFPKFLDDSDATFAGDQPAYHYYTRDHLGNNRTVVSHGGSIEQVNHYYPFGAVYSEAGTNDALQRYKYNGKELDRMHGLNLYDYGARSYDPLLCRFTQTDRFSDKYPWVNPYGLCGNNPVNTVDVNGDSIMIDSKSLAAIYAGIENGTNLYMKFNNGILDPSSISEAVNNSNDFFLKDLYEIATDKRMIELRTEDENIYIMNGKVVHEKWDAPYELNDYNFSKEAQEVIKLEESRLGKHIQGNLGQTLYPGSGVKQSTNNNIQIIINGKGNIKAQSIGIAHEFGHVILHLQGLPSGHGRPGVNPFVYGRSSMMSKRLGYDY